MESYLRIRYSNAVPVSFSASSCDTLSRERIGSVDIEKLIRVLDVQ